MPLVTVNGTKYIVEAGSCLRDIMVSAALGMPCGGKGICGKCRVHVSGIISSITEAERSFLTEKELAAGVRLACYTTVEGDCTVTAVEPESMQICMSPDTMMNAVVIAGFQYGAAVDIGTTTIAAAIYDGSGKQLAGAATLNPQIPWGADVLSRAEASVKGASTTLAQSVQTAVSNLLAEASQKAGLSVDAIEKVVITGNTAMLCLFTDTSVKSMLRAPFHSGRLFGETLAANECGLHGLSPETPVYLPRCIGAFLGADLVCAIQYAGLCDRENTALLVDVGTNGEMALWHKGKLYVCSTAAGPAFEGVGISCGMPAYNGAVDHVTLANGQLIAHTIGSEKAKGICGSGLVDAIACLRDAEEIDPYGCMERAECAVAEDVIITGEDVQALLVAKSAICSGILTLLHTAGVSLEDVTVMYLAGGFSSGLNVRQAGRIGMFPLTLMDRVRMIGNAALGGAAMLLLDRQREEQLQSLLSEAYQMNLATDPYFVDVFIRNMMLPY